MSLDASLATVEGPTLVQLERGGTRNSRREYNLQISYCEITQAGVNPRSEPPEWTHDQLYSHQNCPQRQIWSTAKIQTKNCHQIQLNGNKVNGSIFT